MSKDSYCPPSQYWLWLYHTLDELYIQCKGVANIVRRNLRLLLLILRFYILLTYFTYLPVLNRLLFIMHTNPLSIYKSSSSLSFYVNDIAVFDNLNSTLT